MNFSEKSFNIDRNSIPLEEQNKWLINLLAKKSLNLKI